MLSLPYPSTLTLTLILSISQTSSQPPCLAAIHTGVAEAPLHSVIGNKRPCHRATVTVRKRLVSLRPGMLCMKPMLRLHFDIGAAAQVVPVFAGGLDFSSPVKKFFYDPLGSGKNFVDCVVSLTGG